MSSKERISDDLESLKESQAYIVVREVFQPWHYEKDPFPAGKYGFTVVPGDRFCQKIVDIAQKLASDITTGLGLHDDLETDGCFDPGSQRAKVYRLAHSLEHIAVLNLVSRGIVQLPPTGMGYAGGTTLAYSRNDEKSVEGDGFTFFFRLGIASDEEQLTSVSQAINMVNSLF